MQIVRGPAGEKYLRLLSLVGLPGPEALLVKLSHHNCLEALALEMGDMPRLFLSNLDRVRLSRCAPAPRAAAQPRSAHAHAQ